MKILNKHIQHISNLTLIQVETLKGEGFGFLPAGPALENDTITIKEVVEEGSVNTLLAINPTDNHYLLTDMDLLKGAKQNRVVNVSVLLQPNTKRQIDVSCVERSRWRYDSPGFKPSGSSMHAKIRAMKADSLRNDMKMKMRRTQGELWNTISNELHSNGVFSSTEDYNELLEAREKKQQEMQPFMYAEGCNGLAVLDGKSLVGFDLFGNRDTYRYYFSLLEKNARSCVRSAYDKKEHVTADEAFYLLTDILYTFEEHLEEPADPKPGQAGHLRWSGIDKHPGFSLDMDEHLVHMAGFGM